MQKNILALKRLRKVMRLCTLQVVIMLIVGGTALAHTTYAQVLNREVTLSLSDVTLEKALRELEVNVDVKFVYSPERIKLNEIVTIEVAKKRLQEVLHELLTPRGIEFVQDGSTNFVVLKPVRKKVNERPDRASGKESPSTAPVEQAYVSITGVVTDAFTNQALPGVNVVLKGTTNGTNTDANGRYTMQATAGDVLVFSFIGFATQEILVASQTTIDVVLQEDAARLNEVVVNAGYYNTTKEYQTGNISRVTAKEIEKQPVSNPLMALQGRMPGVQITQLSGVPGANFTVRIRGTNSIANGNDPLYIIDGVPFTSTTLANTVTSQEIFSSNGTSPLNGINPTDIESIEVLKDADATAIYGSRGSNGVVLITTKKGSSGRTKLQANFYQGVGKIATKVSLLNTQQYLEIRDEAFSNAGVAPAASDYDVNGTWSREHYTDWQDVLIGGTAKISDAQLSISGGDQHTKFSMSSGYHRETTVFPGDYADQRVSTRFNVSNVSPNGKLNTNATITYSIVDTNLIKADLTQRALTLAPNAPTVYDENGNLNWQNSTWQNPLSFTKTNFSSGTSTLIGNVVLGYTLMEGLEIKSSMGYTNTRMDAITTTPKSSSNPAFAQNTPHRSNFSNSSFKNWIVEPQLAYRRKVGKGVLNGLIGTSFLSQESSSIGQFASGFASEALMKDIRAASTVTTSNNSYAEYRYHSIFGRLNYIHNEKYIINVTARRDGSSRFGPGNKFSNFGAVGMGWIFSKENVVKNLIPFLSFGKLRGSYGTTGNDQLQNYAFLDTYSSTTAYEGVPGLNPVRLSNPDFSWESNKKLEATLDLGFFEDRISMATTIYRNRSSNQLVGYPLAPTTGFTSIQGNFPATVENRGFEFQMNSILFEKPDFSWSMGFNLTVPKTELIDFPNLASFQSYVNRFEIGESLNISKTYRYLGIDPITGLYQFEDINGDGLFNQSDRVVIREIGPRLLGGMNNSFRYKGFELDVFIQYINQTQNSYFNIYATPGFFFNQPTIVMDRWRQESDQSTVQMISVASSASTAQGRLGISERSVVDASFFRLKNVSVSYTMPRLLSSKLHMESLRLFILGQNLFTATDYVGSDPENPGTSLPPLKVLTVGINVIF